MEFVEKAARGRRRAVLRTAPTAPPWAAAAGCAAAPTAAITKKAPSDAKNQTDLCCIPPCSSLQRIILRRLCAVFPIYAPNSVHCPQTPNFISIMRLQMKTASFIIEGKPAKEESLQSKTTDRSENIRCLLNDGRQTALHGKILNVKTAKTKNSIPNAV